MASQAQPAAQGQDDPPVFSLEFKLEVPKFVASAVWSTDNRILVIVPSGLPFLRLVNVEQRQQQEWKTPFRFEFLSVAISPDNRLLALYQPTQRLRALWLYSISDRKAIANAKVPFDDCFPFLRTPGGLDFAPDGSGLWVGCVGPRLVSGGYSAAIRLNLTDLKVQDRAVFTSFSDVYRAEALSSANRLLVHEGKLLWAQVITTFTAGSHPLKTQYIRVIDLTTKQEPFPPFRIRAYIQSALLHSIIISPRQDNAIVFRLLLQEPAPPAGTSDFTFEVYDTRMGRIMTEFWSRKDAGDPERGGQVNHVALIPGSSYLVGAIDAVLNRQKHGGLIVWNARTGAVVQRISGPSAQHVSVSGDGKRIALFTGGLLFMYRRNP